MATWIAILDRAIKSDVSNFGFRPEGSWITVVGFQHGRTESIQQYEDKHDEALSFFVAEYHHEHA